MGCYGPSPVLTTDPAAPAMVLVIAEVVCKDGREVTRNVFSCVLPLDVGDRKSALGLVTGGYVNVKSGQQDKGEYRTSDNVRSQLVCCWRPIAKRVTTFSISDTPFELWRLCHTCAHTSCSFNKWYHTSCLWKCVGNGSFPNLLTSFSQTLSFPDCSYEWGGWFWLDPYLYAPKWAAQFGTQSEVFWDFPQWFQVW